MDSQQFDTFEDVDPETIQRLSKSDTSRFMRCNGRIGSLDATLNGIMDTGGFNSSYISMDLADKLRNTLQPFQIRVGKGIVLFGSSKRTAAVKESFLLTVDIIVNKTKHGKLTTWFNVLDIESGFIIGLPDLVAKLPKLFLGRFRQAIKSYHGLPEELTEKEQELIDMLSHVEKRPARPHLGRNLGSSKQSESYPSEAKLFIIQQPFSSLERGQEVDTWTMDHDEDAHEANEGYPGCITELTHAMSEDTIDHKIAEFLLEGLSKIEAYQKTRINIQILWKEIDFSLDEHIHFNRMIQNDISSLEKNQINSSGYVIDSLEASLWCFLKTNSFEEAILTAVNLGRDTDTIGAITGGLAGLFYGRKQMPEHWIVSLARMEDILDLGERLNKRNT